MRELTVKDIVKMFLESSGSSVVVAIGQYPGKRVIVPKEKLAEAVKRIRMVGGFVWIPVPIKHKLAIEAPYDFLIANADAFLYPDHICSEIGCKPPRTEAEVVLVKLDSGKAILLLNCDGDAVSTYRKIVSYLADTADTSDYSVKLIEGEVFVPVRLEDIEEKTG